MSNLIITYLLRKNPFKNSSRGSSWIYIKFDHFSIKNQLKNELQRLRLDLLYIKLDHFSIKNQVKNDLQRLGPDLH